jgi:hypothetical protein
MTSSARQQYDSAHLSSHIHALPGRTSPSRRNDYNTEDIPTQPRFLRWARSPFFNSQINEGIELRERRREIVDVPLGQGRPVSPFFPIRMFDSTYIMQRIYSRREVEMDKENARNARKAEKQKAREMKNTKNASAGSSRPSQSSVAQQPGEEVQTVPTPEPHSIGVPTSSTTYVIVANSAGTAHWIRFWSAACCMSTQNADGDH